MGVYLNVSCSRILSMLPVAMIALRFDCREYFKEIEKNNFVDVVFHFKHGIHSIGLGSRKMYVLCCASV